MATIKEALYDRLSSGALLFALVGTRIYPNVATQSAVRPYVVYDKGAGFRHQHMTASSGLVASSFTFDCYGTSAKAAEEIAQAVRDRLESYRGTTLGVQILGTFLVAEIDGFFSPVSSGDVIDHQTRLDFDIWYRESLPTFA